MPQLKDNKQFWAQKMSEKLEKMTPYIPETKPFYFDKLDEIYHKLIQASEKLDDLGLEISSLAVLNVAEAIDNEINHRPIKLSQIATLDHLKIADLEQEFSGEK